jgi:hypothetical protein
MVATFSVTSPVVTVLLNVMVLFEELKFDDGVVKVKTGKSMAPGGVLVTFAVSVAVPAKPSNVVSVTRPVPDEPCVAMVIGVREAAVKLNPLTLIVRVPEIAVLLFESVTCTVKL